MTPTKKIIKQDGKGKGKKGKEQTGLAATPGGPAVQTPNYGGTAPSVPKEKRICGFFNSKAGCKQVAAACRGDHRTPSSPADHEALTTFFTSFKKLEAAQRVTTSRGGRAVRGRVARSTGPNSQNRPACLTAMR